MAINNNPKPNFNAKLGSLPLLASLNHNCDRNIPMMTMDRPSNPKNEDAGMLMV